MDISLETSGSDPDLSSQLKGDIIIPELPSSDVETSNADYNTLDEPIMNTITRDLKTVGKKIGGALAPTANNIIMKEWDLWGPLIMCTYIGLILQGIRGDSDGSQFTQIFILFWVGVGVITYNFVFITACKISIFQCICVLGYCLGPLAIAATIFESMHLLDVSSGTWFLRFIISACGAAWSAFAASRILVNTATAEKKYMALGPVVVLYFLISLLILYHSA